MKMPNILKQMFSSVNSESKLQQLLIGQQALLKKMSLSDEADVLDRAVIKRGKKWKIDVETETMSRIVQISGTVSLQKTAYNPCFDVKVIVFKKKFKNKKELGTIKVKGIFSEMSFEIVKKKEQNIKDIELKKYASFSLLPVYINSILHPIALELLELKGGE